MTTMPIAMLMITAKKNDDAYCKLDCDELDTLETTADLAPCQCTPHSCTLRANHSRLKAVTFPMII